MLTIHEFDKKYSIKVENVKGETNKKINDFFLFVSQSVDKYLSEENDVLIIPINSEDFPEYIGKSNFIQAFVNKKDVIHKEIFDYLLHSINYLSINFYYDWKKTPSLKIKVNKKMRKIKEVKN